MTCTSYIWTSWYIYNFSFRWLFVAGQYAQTASRHLLLRGILTRGILTFCWIVCVACHDRIARTFSPRRPTGRKKSRSARSNGWPSHGTPTFNTQFLWYIVVYTITYILIYKCIIWPSHGISISSRTHISCDIVHAIPCLSCKLLGCARNMVLGMMLTMRQVGKRWETWSWAKTCVLCVVQADSSHSAHRRARRVHERRCGFAHNNHSQTAR